MRIKTISFILTLILMSMGSFGAEQFFISHYLAKMPNQMRFHIIEVNSTDSLHIHAFKIVCNKKGDIMRIEKLSQGLKSSFSINKEGDIILKANSMSGSTAEKFSATAIHKDRYNKIQRGFLEMSNRQKLEILNTKATMVDTF